MANSVPPKGERRQGTGALPKYARGMAPAKPKQGPPAPKPAAKAKAGEAARNGKSSNLPSRGAGEAARSGRATSAPSRAGEGARSGRATSAPSRAGESARNGKSSNLPARSSGEAARNGKATTPAQSKAYSKYRQDVLDYMSKIPGGTAQYVGELQRLQKEGSYDKRYGQSPNQRASDATNARKKSAASNKAEKTKANRNRGEEL